MRRSAVGGLLVVVATSLLLLVSSASAVAASSASRAVDRKTAGGTEGLRHSCAVMPSASRWPSRARPPSWERRAPPRMPAGRTCSPRLRPTGTRWPS